MADIYQVRAEQHGTFSIYKNNHMIVFNLDGTDVQHFCKQQKVFGSAVIDESRADFESRKPFDIYAKSEAKGPGRGLILAPHLHLVRSMVEEDPGTTAQDVGHRLRHLGIRFAALSAVKNLARKHGIKLAA